jgi:hypothetical protein
MRNVVRSILIVLLSWAAANAQAQTLPDMQSVEAVTRPAVEEVKYESWFLKTLVMRSTNETCQIRMIFVRYNYAQQLLADERESANVMTVEIPNAYPRVAGYTVWQQAMGSLVMVAANCAKEQEVLNKIAAIDRQIKQAKAADPDADVSTLETTKATETAALDAIIQGLGPIKQE